jgi:hypothetical protein
MSMEPVRIEFATGEQAREGLLYPPEADRDLLHTMSCRKNAEIRKFS